jgi:para-nitrobenzyl esterase
MSARSAAAAFVAKPVVAAIGAVPALSAGPVVVTPNGALEGVATVMGSEWRGIPYAAPPVGALRWRPPSPVVAVDRRP